MKPRFPRFPLIAALMTAGGLWAAVKGSPFHPPDRAARLAASEAAVAPGPLRPLLDDLLYNALAVPQPGDWLAELEEEAQSVKDFRTAGTNQPDGTRKVLYLLPLGGFPGDGPTPRLEVLRDYLGRFFMMEARLLKPVGLAEPGAKQRIHPGTRKPQLLTGDLLRWLPSQLPADAYCLLAVTMSDLYPEDSWNFVFGEATLTARVGVFSLARNDPAFFGKSRVALPEPQLRSLLLRRACLILSHETGHMFGWEHCRYYQCLMGGSNSLEESDRSPAGLCPVCLHKLYLGKSFDPVKRQKGLVDFYQTHGLTLDGDQAGRVLKAAQKVESR